MRGGGSDEMDPTCVPSGNPRPLGGYQPNMMPEPSSPASAWQYHSVVPKQEPVDHEEQNDSGVTSGSDFHSSSPGSDHSTNIPYSSPITEQPSHSGYQSAYYSTPFTRMNQSMPFTYETQAGFSRHLNSNDHNPLTPPNSEPILLPNGHYSMTPALNNAESKNEVSGKPTTLTPCTSPDEPSTSRNPPSVENNDSDDSLSRLQMSLEKSGLLPSDLSSKLSECSGENENKSDNETDEYDEQGLRIPKVNSHGKVKTFRCKQCDFVAVTKLDFWEHSKKHIKADKLLTCPKCPFVTEYKHHLEYHLRNHFGSKPFKCSQCNYSCVNKSMLNSHLKSHSNIYQFRCSDCSYATKYCHSLKLHLRKYKHEPDIVLNPDGTPNPLPIIDVYGTRRGPKVKGSESRHTEEGAPKSDQLLPFSLNQFMLNQAQQLQLPFAGFPFFGRFPGALPNPFLLQNLEQFARAGPSIPPVQEAAEETPAESMETEEEVLDLSKPGGSTQRNRRKGRAFKLVPTHSDSSDEDEETTMFSNVEVVQNKEAEESSREDSSEDKNETSSNNNKDDYTCQYCNINFGDPVLYTIHMGYHGYQNPFTCNMCGEECKDKISFFLHIARTSHS